MSVTKLKRLLLYFIIVLLVIDIFFFKEAFPVARIRCSVKTCPTFYYTVCERPYIEWVICPNVQSAGEQYLDKILYQLSIKHST